MVDSGHIPVGNKWVLLYSFVQHEKSRRINCLQRRFLRKSVRAHNLYRFNVGNNFNKFYNQKKKKMSQIKFLTQKETKDILAKLKEQFGISKIPGILVMPGKERIFLYTGNLSEEKINKIEERIFVERAGIYFCKEELGEIRLSLEGVQLLKDQITKGIFELENAEQLEQWMTGQELPIKTGLHGVLAIKYKKDFLGCGKASENKIGNFIPKNRRLRINSKIE